MCYHGSSAKHFDAGDCEYLNITKSFVQLHKKYGTDAESDAAFLADTENIQVWLDPHCTKFIFAV